MSVEVVAALNELERGGKVELALVLAKRRAKKSGKPCRTLHSSTSSIRWQT